MVMVAGVARLFTMMEMLIMVMRLPVMMNCHDNVDDVYDGDAGVAVDAAVDDGDCECENHANDDDADDG